MTPAEALEQLLPRWRASLPEEYSPELVDGFVRRHRQHLEDLLAQVIGVRKLRRGALPRSPADFTAVKFLAENERRPHYAATDKDLAKRLRRRTEKLAAAATTAEARDALRQRIDDYVRVRAEALLMEQMGWDAVPLLLRRPLLAVYSAASVVIVHRHGADGSEEAIFPGLEDSVDDLKADLEVAHEAATAILGQIGDRGPEAIWARARGRGAAEIRSRAHVVCRRCGSRLREPARHYMIGTIECPAGADECISAEQDAEEIRLRKEETQRQRAEAPARVAPAHDTQAERERQRKEQADKAWRKAEQRRRREEREREKEDAARRREEKARNQTQSKADLDAEEWFESGELPRTIDELAAYKRFAERERPDEEQDDNALIAWVTKRRDALMGRRPDIEAQEAGFTAEVDFVRLRAEAILLRALGHEAIPLMLLRPTLTVAIGDDTLLVHRHFPPELVLQTGDEISRFDYFSDAPETHEAVRVLRDVHAQIERLRVELGGMDMEEVAPALWQSAREVASTVKTADPEREELDAFYALLAPEPVDRFGRMVHETRWASRAAAIRQLERAGFKFIKGTRSTEGYWSRFPRTAVVKGATVQVTAAL